MKTSLTVIDAQNDFVDPKGSLFVPGSPQDIKRISDFITDNASRINRLCETYDTHKEWQVFHPAVWMAIGVKHKHLGQHPPQPFTQISLNDLNKNWAYIGEWPDQVRRMFEQKATTRKPDLTIWPLHCILGTWGHNLHPEIKSAFSLHYAITGRSHLDIQKGESPFTEHHGAVRAEVGFEEDPSTWRNTKLINFWNDHDTNIITGEASSHCVLETLEHIEEEFGFRGLSSFVVFTDCMSPVPDIKDEHGNVIVPFKAITDKRFAELEQLGMRFMKSTEFEF